MSYMEAFRSATIFLIVCLVTTPIGCLLHVIGLATDYWTSSTIDLTYSNTTAEIHSGLWSTCYDGSCNSWGATPDWILASRAMAIIGLLASAAVVMMVYMLAFGEEYAPQKKYHVVTFITSLAAAGFIALTVIIYGVSYKSKFAAGTGADWSFWLSVFGTVVYVISAVLLLCNMMRQRD